MVPPRALELLARHPLTAALPARVEVVQGDVEQPDSVAAAAAGADAASSSGRASIQTARPASCRALADTVEHRARAFAEWALDHVEDFTRAL